VLVALASLVAAGRAPAWSNPRSTLRLCIADQREERASAALLARFLSTVRLEPAPTPSCRGAGVDYVGWFDRRSGGTTFVVRARSGEELARTVPWLAPSGSAAPLSELAAADRLSEFSILVDGLLAQHRSTPPPPPVIEPLPEAVGPAPFLEPGEPPALRPETPLGYRPPPRPAAVSPRRPAVARPVSAAPVKIARLQPAVRRSPAATLVTAPPARSALPFWADLSSAWVLRAPALSGAQLGAALGWRWLFARGAGQATTWRWDGRQIAFRALTAELGLRLPMAATAGGRLRLAGVVAAMAEAVTLRREDVAGAPAHSYLDGGGLAGAQLGYHPRPWARLALLADAAYRPTGHRVAVAGGPSLDLNAWSARVGVAAGLAW
jgi:hypothetical protein